MKQLLSWCETEQPWMDETIEALVRLESPTTDKAAVDACGRELAARLGTIDGRVRRYPREAAGDHLLAEFGRGTRQVLLLAHIDTVWPVGSLAALPLRREGDRWFGPGIYDMKAGLAIAMQALRALRSSAEGLPGRVVLLCTTDEETGSETSRALIEDVARRSNAVLVFEPSLPGGAVKTQRKGCGEFTLRVRGVAAHAGIEPGRGSNAIHELARQILAVESLQDPGRGLSVNVGLVHGGTRTNVIAAEAEAMVDVRVTSMEDARRLTAALRALRTTIPGTSLDVTGGVNRPPFERTPGGLGLFRQARALAAEVDRELDEGATGGGSDGNFTAALGVPTLDGLGAVGGGAHALDEHVEAAHLPWRAALAAGLIRQILVAKAGLGTVDGRQWTADSRQ
ncbi:MAG: M20 family metallopeptidase [Acidobacteriota bacterium]